MKESLGLCKRGQGTATTETTSFTRRWASLGEGPSAQAVVIGYTTTEAATTARKEMLTWFTDCTSFNTKVTSVEGSGQAIQLPAEVKGKADVVEAVAVRAVSPGQFTTHENGILIQVGNRLMWADVAQYSGGEAPCALTSAGGKPQCTVYANAAKLAEKLAS